MTNQNPSGEGNPHVHMLTIEVPVCMESEMRREPEMIAQMRLLKSEHRAILAKLHTGCRVTYQPDQSGLPGRLQWATTDTLRNLLDRIHAAYEEQLKGKT